MGGPNKQRNLFTGKWQRRRRGHHRAAITVAVVVLYITYAIVSFGDCQFSTNNRQLRAKNIYSSVALSNSRNIKMTEDYFWGVTLDKSKNTEVWDPDLKPDANDSTNIFRGEHTLLVKQAVLGPEVQDGEVNVIEVEAMGYKSDIKFPVVVLKGGSGHSQCVLDLLFPDPPVTFKLVKGNGPIHLLGNHSVGTGDGMADEEDDDDIDEEFEEEEEDVIEDEKNSVDEKKRKIATNSISKAGKAAKRPKVDDDN